jgi:hypothetical protein
MAHLSKLFMTIKIIVRNKNNQFLLRTTIKIINPIYSALRLPK